MKSGWWLLRRRLSSGWWSRKDLLVFSSCRFNCYFLTTTHSEDSNWGHWWTMFQWKCIKNQIPKYLRNLNLHDTPKWTFMTRFMLGTWCAQSHWKIARIRSMTGEMGKVAFFCIYNSSKWSYVRFVWKHFFKGAHANRTFWHNGDTVFINK